MTSDSGANLINLTFQTALADRYASGPQKIKNLSEHWVGQEVYCSNCGRQDISRYGNNRPVADFFCSDCNEDYELKSQGRPFGSSIADGAYRTMIERLNGNKNPNLLLLQYDPQALSVLNLLIVPKHFFTPEIIEVRKPLSATARRAGWTGCKILLQGIPKAGRIFLVRNRVAEPKALVLENWRATLFLRDQKNAAAKGWLLGVMKSIEKIGKRTFTLEELYKFEGDFHLAYPLNQHLRPKIRQQVQILRDKGFLEFVGRGIYRLTAVTAK